MVATFPSLVEQSALPLMSFGRYRDDNRLLTKPR